MKADEPKRNANPLTHWHCRICGTAIHVVMPGVCPGCGKDYGWDATFDTRPGEAAFESHYRYSAERFDCATCRRLLAEMYQPQQMNLFGIRESL